MYVNIIFIKASPKRHVSKRLPFCRRQSEWTVKLAVVHKELYPFLANHQYNIHYHNTPSVT